MSARSVAVVTHFPSPYQVELFNAVERLRPGELTVHYLHRADPARQWAPPAFGHRARFLGDGAGVLEAARETVAACDFLVLNFYDDPRALSLLAARTRSRRPWCFWGERPGFRHPLLGRLRRRWTLRALHRSSAPVWGIGQWAVAAYRREYGPDRDYVNLPYFSDLSAFEALPAAPATAARTLLYSGSLTHRKGVDLLAGAFAALAREDPRVRLMLMGRGELEERVRRTLAPFADRVEWIGFKPWGELAATYGRAHVLCVPSRHDGWGLVVAEGLAAGLPVIASDRVGAAIDLVRAGENGWSCRAGDEASLHAAMRAAAAASPATLRAMGERARASVASHTLAEGARRFVAAVNCGIEAPAR